MNRRTLVLVVTILLGTPLVGAGQTNSSSEKVRLSEIFISTEGSRDSADSHWRAMGIAFALKNGARFDEEAKQNSSGPSAKDGGDIGYFSRQDLSKTIADQVFALPIGDISPIFERTEGFVILKVTDHLPPGAKEPSSTSSDFEVLSNTLGTDFGPYLSKLMETVRSNWYSLVPASARAPLLKSGIVRIRFSIQKDGNIKKMSIVKGSGDTELDRAAWGGISASNPAPPLPAEFKGSELVFQCKFTYNPTRMFKELRD